MMLPVRTTSTIVTCSHGTPIGIGCGQCMPLPPPVPAFGAVQPWQYDARTIALNNLAAAIERMATTQQETLGTDD
jgi:hypothetical protein